MADAPLRFRCYKCNQLLGIPQKRAGTIVACPRCGEELLAPATEATAPPERDEPGRTAVSTRTRPRRAEAEAPGGDESSSIPPFPADIAAGLPEEIVGLRPEDIRVEAGVLGIVTDASPSHRPPARRDDQPEPVLAVVDESPDPPIEELLSPATESQTPEPGILPPIAIEAPSLLSPDRELRPVREVVLQPATILAWSLIVLLSIPLAFIAGLMVGHYFWKGP